MLQLTSYERLRRYLADSDNDIKEDSQANRRDLIAWVSPISNKVQNYLNRDLTIAEYTEYFDLRPGKRQFWVNNPDISSIVSVKSDPDSLFDGNEVTLTSDQYFIDRDDNSVVLQYPEPFVGEKMLEIVYNGGLSSSGVTSVYATTDASAWTLNNRVIGDDSFSLGLVKAKSTTSMTVEVMYGTFTVGETLTEYSDEGVTATGETATLSSKTVTCLAESHPDVVTACEMEIRYLNKHKRDFENTGTQQNGTTIRRDGSKTYRLILQPESIDLLQHHKRVAMV